MQEPYQKLGTAVLRQACRDLIRFSGAGNRREYRSARRFLDSALFRRICRSEGADPGRVRQLILQYVQPARTPTVRVGEEQAAEDRPLYRIRQ